MNASTRIERLRNLTMYNWYRTKAEYQKEQVNEQSAEVVQNRRLGGYLFFENQVLVESDDCSCDPTFHYTLDEAVFLAFDALMAYEAAVNLGPTRCARYNYLWFATMAQAYHWVLPALPGAPTGTHDAWDWDTHTPLESPTDRFVWMNHMLVHVMPTFVPGYDTAALLANERRAFGWDDAQQAAEVSRVHNAGDWTTWLGLWTTWWTARGSDGSDAAIGTQPTNVQLPNVEFQLEVSGTTNPADFPRPYEWTPLKLSMKPAKQGYLTYNWNDVTSSAVGIDETSIKSAADNYFLSRPGDNAARLTEIQALLNLAAPGVGLSDLQKVIAEFWAGGPNTVSPPGMCAWLWRDYMETYNVAHTRGFPTFFYSGLDMAIHTFETSRLVWGLKKAHGEARPIQEIRRLFYNSTVRAYDGTAVLGKSWVPYQEANFVTPPFADFPSGHSAFSRSFAQTMADWFGDAIPASAPKERTTLALLSPVFTQPQTQPFATFVFPAGGSQIQAGVVPAAPLTLSWTTWSSMAESAGVSRQYGGIHAASAHSGSVALADALHGELRSVWGIAPSSVPIAPE